ncbi:MAG: hypothetical protein JW839_18765 [Candidatus Lokiarchaeota archaeon]|nr:hypothetical protein [Candidatus Lokiarchaeota archaeon]
MLQVDYAGLMFSLDWWLRVSLISLCAVFWIYALVLARKAGAAGISVKKKYFISFSFFFLSFVFNFLQTELRIAEVFQYLDVIPDGFDYFIGMPDEWMAFMFLFFFLGAVPMAFAIERYLLMHKKVVLTLLSIIALAMTISLFIFSIGPNYNGVLIYVVISVDYLAMIAVTLSVLILYLRIAIIGSGNLRVVGLLIFFGFICEVAGLILSSDTKEIGHGIMLVGFVLIFIGMTQMK